jgi:hypothetical protein
MAQYTVRLVNFGTIVYQGMDPNRAIDAAVESGFESVVETADSAISYSPVFGWRSIWSRMRGDALAQQQGSPSYA